MDKLLIGRVGELLKDTAQSIVIVTHTNPDGDAIGSCLSLYGCLTAAGYKHVSVLIPNHDPGFLHWMPWHDQIITASSSPNMAIDLIQQASKIFCLDFNHLNRTDQLEHLIRDALAEKILIDHHPQPGNDFHLYLTDTGVSSTAEMIYELLVALEFEQYIGQSVAECIYTGIVTDTGSFSYGINNPRTFEIISELIKTGINGEGIHRLIYSTYSESRIRLLGYCLSEKLVVIADKRTAYISLTRKELQKYHHKVGDTEGIVNYALSIQGIDLAALFTENKDHIKISFRSSGKLDVNEFARIHFHGGGHKNASGGKSFIGMNETLKRFELLVKEIPVPDEK